MKWLVTSLFLLCATFAIGQQDSTAKQNYTVYVFLGENCPICQFHTLTLNKLYKEYGTKGVAFVGVFPNPESDSASIDEFRAKYQILFPLKKDTGRKLMKKLGAEITPQVFLIANDSIVYNGRINDAFETLGVKKSKIQSPDLENAIKAVLNNQPVSVAKTEAIGCFIDSEY